jgi:MFS family permease
MAYISSAMSVGLILGPVLGGVIYAQRGYYTAFGLAFVFIGLDLVLRLILIEKKIALRFSSAVSTNQEDPLPLKLKSPSPKVPNLPSRDFELSTPSEAISTLMRGLNTEPRSRIPPVIRILKYPRLLVALLVSFLQAVILSALDATLPLYLNALFNYTSLQAGILLGGSLD